MTSPEPKYLLVLRGGEVFASPRRGAATYTVRPPGEFLYQIADRLWKDADRWGELAQLNPGVSPETPVKPGTVLKLPAAPPAPAAVGK